ncbi:MvdC/MvdD family ATP grasp protein [Campylobacter sp. CCS1377]|uniref:MvdC/MvdD family ATP grasp protein n=1 Tax=Campylobacter sp. CCS1377 TaxID=3158229 RepID=A0AAU7E9D4_9BACT
MNALKLLYFRLNLDTKSLYNTFISFQNHSWHIKNEISNIKSDDISCVWLRRSFVELSLEEKESKEKDIDFKIWRNEFNATLLGLFHSLKDLPWLNPISHAFKGDNKYYQMSLAKQLGLKIPKTIVSNEKEKLLQFCKICKSDVIFKSRNLQIRPRLSQRHICQSY